MPRSTIANRRDMAFDANLELRDYDAAAISATTNGTAILAYPIQSMEFRAIVDVAAYTSYSAGSAEWTISIGVAATSGGSYTTVGSVTPVGTAARFTIPLSGSHVEGLLSTAKYIRVTATKTGSPGNLTYGCFLAPAAADY